MCASNTSATLFLLFERLTGAGKFSLFEHVSRDPIRHSEAASWLILAIKIKDQKCGFFNDSRGTF